MQTLHCLLDNALVYRSRYTPKKKLTVENEKEWEFSEDN
jgi:hypothetical protein